MKRAILLVALLLTVVLLVGCAARETTQYPEADAAMQRDPMALSGDDYIDDAEDEYDWDSGDYDPASEEDESGDEPENDVTFTADQGGQVYAGATPIPLDPIDLPTPTPHPSLTFAYGPVQVNNLGLSFEAPAGWTVDASTSDTVTITDPTPYDGVNAVITISISNVEKSYRLNDVKTTLKDKLKELGQYNFSKWTTKSAAQRTLLKKDGYYNDYEGEYYDGKKVSGRVHIVLLDGNKILTLHLSCPYGMFESSYKKVYNQFRETAKMT